MLICNRFVLVLACLGLQIPLFGQIVPESTEQPIDSMKSDSSVVDTTKLPEESLGILNDSLQEEIDLQEELLALQSAIDSLREVNKRLASAATRRLTIDMFVDSFRQFIFYSCMVKPEKIPISFYNRKTSKGKKIHSFESLLHMAEDSGKTLVFAMNAGMYKRNQFAQGIFIAEGQQQAELDTLTEGYGNFYMQPNGVFALDSANYAYVVPTRRYLKLADTVVIKYATQSGPMLVVDGQINPKFNDGSPNRHIRNGVGVTADNQVIMAISERPVTFFELSSFLLQYGCVNALYLDGAISRAYMPEINVGEGETGKHLGPIIGIIK